MRNPKTAGVIAAVLACTMGATTAAAADSVPSEIAGDVITKYGAHLQFAATERDSKAGTLTRNDGSIREIVCAYRRPDSVKFGRSMVFTVELAPFDPSPREHNFTRFFTFVATDGAGMGRKDRISYIANTVHRPRPGTNCRAKSHVDMYGHAIRSGSITIAP